MDPAAVFAVGGPLRARPVMGAAIVLVLVGLGVAVLVSAFGAHGATETVRPPLASQSPVPGATGSTGAAGTTPSGARGATIYVHLLGAVNRPGLYLLVDGDRALDVIAAAGGFSSTAEQSALNLARRLVDGEQILVPNLGEALPAANGSPGSTSAKAAKVNINTATEADLGALPRVGPAMAKRIVDWRSKNGRFTALEDLMSVAGVGQKTFDQLKDLVTL